MKEQKYIEIIKASNLNPFDKLRLQLQASFTAFYLKLKESGIEPDESYLIEQMEKAGLNVL